MNKLKKISGIILLLLLGQSLFSQSHYTVNPNIVPQVTADILDDYDHLIDISDLQFQNHVNTIVKPSSYCADCEHTIIEEVTSNQNTLKLKWPAIVGATQYELRYINLENGDTDSFTLTANSTSIPNLPNAAYAFSIVTLYEVNNLLKYSAADIIILEMPILIDDGKLNCKCKRLAEKNMTIDGAVVTWNPMAGKTYQLKFDFSDNSTSKLKIQVSASNNPNQPLAFQLLCAEQANHPGHSNTIFTQTPSNAIIYLFYDGEGYYFQFFTDAAQLISAKLTLCADPVSENNGNAISPRIGDSATMQLFPNPAQDELSIVLPTASEPAAIEIYNNTGQRIYQATAQDNKHVLIIQHWPVGMYRVKINTSKSSITKSFIKQ